MTLSFDTSAIFAIVLVVLILIQMTRPSSLVEPRGRLLGVFIFFLLPILVTYNGFAAHFENSKSTSFCLSCHVMAANGRSLYFDDPEYLPAAHFQNRRIPREQACYTCHTTYTMYGDVTSKLRGLRHLYMQLIGPPEKIELYEPYQNRECLHCHWGARSFAENPIHSDSLEALGSNEISCLVCHSQTHHAEDGEEPPMWSGDSGDIEEERG
jgi:nitrate/TMAO reductase-like tetraheme cytochrome c subunit